MMDREMDTLPQENQSLESSHNSGGFDCNICLELAQEPVVTMCGHLYCWPCLYTWLHMNNMPKECPVCKAFVNEEKLVPLYGRGKIEEVTDTRPKSVMQVPSRPSGHRTQVASSRPTNNTHHPPPHQSFNFMPNQAMGSFGNVSFSGFGLFPYLFGFQMHAAPAHSPYATSTSGFHHNHDHHHHHGTHRFFQQVRQEQQQETFLSRLLLFLGCLVVACLLFF